MWFFGAPGREIACPVPLPGTAKGSSRSELFVPDDPRKKIMKSTIRSQSANEILTIWPAETKLLDATAILQLEREIIELVNGSSQENVVLDFKEVSLMSSSALSSLIRINKKCKEFKINLKFC